MYKYENYRSFVFSEEGQETFLKVRDKAKYLIKLSGAVTCEKLIEELTGLSWEHLACVDRLVELKELSEIENPYSQAGQYRIFIKGLK